MPFGKDKLVAIVGASANKQKYGYRVLADLFNAGWNVAPVNPKSGIILGLKVHNKISSMPELPDGVVFVTQPEVTRKVLEEVVALGIKDIWMQPGAESKEAIEYCEQNGLNCIHDACIMVEKSNLSK